MIAIQDLEVVSLSKPRDRTEQSTTPKKIITRKTNTTSDGSRSQKHSEKTPTSSVTADILKRMTKETNNATKDKPESREEGLSPITHFGFDECFS